LQFDAVFGKVEPFGVESCACADGANRRRPTARAAAIGTEEDILVERA
jgi:hypothetical protein